MVQQKCSGMVVSSKRIVMCPQGLGALAESGLGLKHLVVGLEVFGLGVGLGK